MEPYHLRFDMTLHVSDENEINEVVEAVATAVEDLGQVRTMGRIWEYDQTEYERWRCPVCGQVDVGDTTLQDHGKCYNCFKQWQMNHAVSREFTCWSCSHAGNESPVEEITDLRMCHFYHCRTDELSDSDIEQIWDAFVRVPLTNNCKTDHPFFQWPSDTAIEDIWGWFDEEHSKGLKYLIHGKE